MTAGKRGRAAMDRLGRRPHRRRPAGQTPSRDRRALARPADGKGKTRTGNTARIAWRHASRSPAFRPSAFQPLAPQRNRQNHPAPTRRHAESKDRSPSADGAGRSPQTPMPQGRSIPGWIATATIGGCGGGSASISSSQACRGGDAPSFPPPSPPSPSLGRRRPSRRSG